MIDSLKELLAKHGLTISIAWNNGVNRNGPEFFIGKKFQIGEKEFYHAWFGNFAKDLKLEWKSEGKYSEEELRLAQTFIDKALEEERQEREKAQIEVATQLEKEFQDFSPSGDTPYMRRKLIHSLYGARIKANDQGDPIIIVPMYDENGKFWNYQRIFSKKFTNGDKFFQAGARIEGTFHILSNQLLTLDKIESATKFYICEGFATAASVKLALQNEKNICVVAAFNAGNLRHVAVAIKEKFPSSNFVICADNDAFTLVRGKPDNVGIRKGRQAAGSVKGEIVYPIFNAQKKGMTDFNDLHIAEGIDKVSDQILNFGNYVKGIQPMCLDVSKSGKTIIPSEKELSEYLLKALEGKIVKQERVLFKYNGTHWEELDFDDVDKLKQLIQVAANGLLSIREIDSYFKYFITHVEAVPRGVSMYQPNPYVANFQDKTLHFWQDMDTKEFKFEFKEHNPKDYLLSTLPFKAPTWRKGEPLPSAPMFESMIDTLWEKNPDKDQIRRLIYQLLGGCFVSAFPTIVMFFGEPQSGKSTIIKLLIKLIDQANTCSVEPCEFNGFNMESMVGKLVNFDLDIDTQRPISDSRIKKIIDRQPQRIRRKGRNDIYGYIPAMHFFAGNDLPKSLDGASRAYAHRIILIPTYSFKAPPNAMFDYEQTILSQELEAILARAVAGLYDLASLNGRFTIPDSSLENVKNMEVVSDIVGQFIDELEHGEIYDKSKQVSIGEDLKIGRPELWEVFNNWQISAYPRGNVMGKIQFFRSMDKKGFHVVTLEGVRQFKGIGIISNTNGVV